MHAAREEYLTTEVFTAAPQKLHLMLIEAAIRFARQAERHLQAREYEPAFQALIRSQEIVTQLIAGLAPNLESPLVRRIGSVYAFVHRTLIHASVRRDDRKLAEAIRVLEIERETWRLVCERLGTERIDPAPENGAAPRRMSPLAFDLLQPVGGGHGSLSFEA